MSLHRSLKTKPAALNRHRNVLTRAERIDMLMEQGQFAPPESSPLGLVKVASRKVTTKKKKKEDDEGKSDEEGGEETTAE